MQLSLKTGNEISHVRSDGNWHLKDVFIFGCPSTGIGRLLLGRLEVESVATKWAECGGRQGDGARVGLR